MEGCPMPERLVTGDGVNPSPVGVESGDMGGGPGSPASEID
jgi:hypothetical protein